MQRVIGILILCILSLSVSLSLSAQPIQRPKLVVGIVVDQMRWDYLYRYYDRYAPTGGFRRLLDGGFSCENTFIPYAPTVTACGHSSIYTGAVPAISGIVGNLWYDNDAHREVYCVEDKSVSTVGSPSTLGQMSPRNMLVTTIGDELKLATNFRSKVIGLAIKDRGGILPAGHSANAAYWYDLTTGDWISSTYYMKELPKWAKDLNAKKLADKYFVEGWRTLYPIETYSQSSGDVQSWEGKPFGNSKGFPYDTKAFAGKNYGMLPFLPQGNTMTVEMAKAAVNGEQLGNNGNTDFLAVSFSSPDYIGHTFGPNSVEEEDNYLRLDRDLGEFMDFLDQKIGKDQYIVFLSADHGVAHVPGYMKEHHIPAGAFDALGLGGRLNKILKEKFGVNNLAVSEDEYQVYLNHPAIDSAKLDVEAVKKSVIDYLAADSMIYRVFALDKIMETPLNSKIRNMIVNGYYPRRSGDVQYILLPQYIEGFQTSGTTHGLWNPYDSHIPLVWYGWGIKHGSTSREINMTDIAPTLAALLHIQMPSGCVGQVIPELVK